MGLLDRVFGKKSNRKRTYKEIRYDRILTKQQNLILESSLAANLALKEEIKSLRSVLIQQDDLYQELGIEPLALNQNNQSIPGEFNTSDLLASVAKGIKPDSIPGGRVALDAFATFLQSNSNEVNALGSHYMKQMIPKKEIEKQVVNQ
tara:strand:- start:323 stop:766 length:444 start_codon:yes stop_codon:yes gene_type:complete